MLQTQTALTQKTMTSRRISLWPQFVCGIVPEKTRRLRSPTGANTTNGK